MRRLLCFCLSFLFIFMFAGCGEFVPPEPQKCFSAVADVLYEGMEMVCEVSANGKNNMVISVTYPDNLRGFSYVWNDGSFRIGYNELYCENTASPLPENSFASELGNFINGLYAPESYSYSQQNDEGCVFSTDSGAIFLTDAHSGEIKKVDFLNMTVEFRDFKTKS